MSAISRNPQNTNYLQPTKFTVMFPKISTVTYFCTKVNIPPLSSSPARQNTPFVDLYRPGDKLEYGTFDIEFIIDEEMWSYQVIHDWIRGYTFPCSFDEYKNINRKSFYSMQVQRPQYSDAHLNILSGLNNRRLEVKFVDAFPVSLSEIQFDTASGADQTIHAMATFRYQLFNIERV
jgi:hypothetical protein